MLIGTTSVEISELLARMLTIRKINHNVLNAKLHKKEADIVSQAGNAGIVTIATNMAGRGTDIKISDQIKNDGGLAIVGTERHDSRRVDRQLRGRAGRQGDPGSSRGRGLLLVVLWILLARGQGRLLLSSPWQRTSPSTSLVSPWPPLPWPHASRQPSRQRPPSSVARAARRSTDQSRR